METRHNPEEPQPGLSAASVVHAPLVTVAALDSATFAGLSPNEAIPAQRNPTTARSTAGAPAGRKNSPALQC